MICDSCGRQIMSNEKIYVVENEIYCSDCVVEEQVTHYYFNDDDDYSPLENVEKYSNKNQLENGYNNYIKNLEYQLKNIPEDNVNKSYTIALLKSQIEQTKKLLKKVVDK